MTRCDLTRCAVLTGAGRSAIAVILVWGENATECLTALFRPAGQRPMQPGQIRYGLWIGNHEEHGSLVSTGQDTRPGESTVVVPISAQQYEIHCHGGKAAIGRIIDDLSLLGIQQVPPMPQSGVRHDSIDPDDRFIAEASEVLTECTTPNTAAIALDQVRGALKRWREESIKMISSATANASATANSSANQSNVIAQQAAQIAATGRIGVRLAQPFDIVLAGPPNVGKSSLINALVGYDRSITMDIPGTTRDVLDAETVFDGWPVRLRDTAGLHESDHWIEQQGMNRAIAAIESADLIVQVVQPGIQLQSNEFTLAIQRLDHDVPVLHVQNKSDLEPNGGSVGNAEANKAVIKTVATTGEGVPQLLSEITAALQIQTPQPGSPVPVNDRQMAWVSQIASLGDAPDEMLCVLQQGCHGDTATTN